MRPVRGAPGAGPDHSLRERLSDASDRALARDELLARAASEGRAPRDQDHFLLGPATIYLERIAAARHGLAAPAFWPPRRPRRLRCGVAAAFPYGATRERCGGRPRRCPAAATSASTAAARSSTSAARNWCASRATTRIPLFHGRVCPKSQLTLQLYHSEHRLLYPQKRVGERGEGRFERISWEQALDEIAERLKRCASRMARRRWRCSSARAPACSTTLGYTRLFAQLWGTPNHEGTDPFCASGKNVAYELTQGSDRQRQQLHRGGHRLGAAVPLPRRQPGGDAAGLLRHGQRLAPAERRAHGGGRSAPHRDREQGRPLAGDPSRAPTWRSDWRCATTSSRTACTTRASAPSGSSASSAGATSSSSAATRRNGPRRSPASRRPRSGGSPPRSPRPTVASSSPAAASTSTPTARRPTAC